MPVVSVAVTSVAHSCSPVSRSSAWTPTEPSRAYTRVSSTATPNGPMLKPLGSDTPDGVAGVQLERGDLSGAALHVHDAVDHDRHGAQRAEGLDLCGPPLGQALDGRALELTARRWPGCWTGPARRSAMPSVPAPTTRRCPLGPDPASSSLVHAEPEDRDECQTRCPPPASRRRTVARCQWSPTPCTRRRGQRRVRRVIAIERREHGRGHRRRLGRRVGRAAVAAAGRGRPAAVAGSREACPLRVGPHGSRALQPGRPRGALGAEGHRGLRSAEGSSS